LIRYLKNKNIKEVTFQQKDIILKPSSTGLYFLTFLIISYQGYPFTCKMELILTSPDEISQIVTEAVTRALNSKSESVKELPDRINIDGASQETGLSKSSLYKLTMDNKIPYSKFSGALVFSRKELKNWVEANTVHNTASEDIRLNLAKQANKKGRGK
jgi:predicted DNA-binding transcriptional regulator AlpA